MKYRKKPVIVDAFHYRGKQDDWLLKAFMLDCGRELFRDAETYRWKISTLEGDHLITDGDYIIRGVKGEVYPCKPDIFEMTYEPADQAIEEGVDVINEQVEKVTTFGALKNNGLNEKIKDVGTTQIELSVDEAKRVVEAYKILSNVYKAMYVPKGADFCNESVKTLEERIEQAGEGK